MSCIWNLLRSKGPERLRNYLLLFVDWSFKEEIGEDDSSVTVSRLMKSISSYVSRHGPASSSSDADVKEFNKTEDDVQFEEIFNWIELCAPFMGKVVESQFSSIFFDTPVLSFSAPFLGEGSSIVKPVDLIPLALYKSALQGPWKRLFSTTHDGTNFESMCKHIFGYDVSFAFHY